MADSPGVGDEPDAAIGRPGPQAGMLEAEDDGRLPHLALPILEGKFDPVAGRVGITQALRHENAPSITSTTSPLTRTMEMSSGGPSTSTVTLLGRPISRPCSV